MTFEKTIHDRTRPLDEAMDNALSGWFLDPLRLEILTREMKSWLLPTFLPKKFSKYSSTIMPASSVMDYRRSETYARFHSGPIKDLPSKSLREIPQSVLTPPSQAVGDLLGDTI
jgi:hypothetical protein